MINIVALAINTYHLSLPLSLVFGLTNYYYIPVLCKDIIYFLVLEKDGGYKITIKNKCCSIYLSKFLCAGISMDGLYILNLDDNYVHNINKKDFHLMIEISLLSGTIV